MKIFAVTFLSAIISALNAQTIDQILYEGPPVFHGAKVVGNRPHTELIFTVPATGKRPITFTTVNLPAGLNLEASTGIIRGTVNERGNYTIRVTAKNSIGETSQNIQLVIGDKLCLTPPMGWNSWNVFTNTLDEKMVIEMADAMVSTGMRDLGYQYINMDDYWHDTARAADGKPQANPVKFPHGIKWLADYVHSKGLKLGIYSDAGTKTCGKCFGSYQYEEIDAKTYAEWGVDLLKYDFCFVPWKKKQAVERYTKMGEALKNSSRSITYSVCNWGLFAPWKWAPKAGGNYWRTTPDIIDSWKKNPIWYGSVMSIMKRQNKVLKYQQQGHWNDPDMLIVGNYGNGKATGGKGKYKGLSDLEYQSHMALWAFTNAPLLSSCDLLKMNEPTKNILMNAELLAINQDSLTANAVLTLKKNGVWYYEKQLSNHKVAHLAVNVSGKPKTLTNLNTDKNAAPKKDTTATVLKPHQSVVFVR